MTICSRSVSWAIASRSANAFQYFLLHFSLGQDVLQRKAVLAGAPLQGLRRAGGCLGYGDVLRLQGRGLAQLCQRWLAAERAGQPLTRGADEGGAFLQAAADLDGAVVPRKRRISPAIFGTA